MGCFLDDLRAFDINVDQWMIAAQDEEELRRTTEKGPDRFIPKEIAVEKARAGLLPRAVVCPNVTGRTTERRAQSKWARAGSLAIDD